ncbi:MAG: NUDIX domain-containing protein [Gemmatimonadetes bacterium]|nr:NUDIX domain-containing protein [Gemmatimonadota bacterium]
MRCAGAWEAVHGSIEPGELPVAAGLRELEEETGLVPIRFYNLSRTESFYLHRIDQVALIPTFAAVVDAGAPVRLSIEHDAFRWLPIHEAAATVAWPRERRCLSDVAIILATGTAGPLEDVLRIEPS